MIRGLLVLKLPLCFLSLVVLCRRTRQHDVFQPMGLLHSSEDLFLESPIRVSLKADEIRYDLRPVPDPQLRSNHVRSMKNAHRDAVERRRQACVLVFAPPRIQKFAWRPRSTQKSIIALLLPRHRPAVHRMCVPRDPPQAEAMHHGHPGKITSGAVGFWGYRLRYVFAAVADALPLHCRSTASLLTD
jgi:hypothetical protein